MCTSNEFLLNNQNIHGEKKNLTYTEIMYMFNYRDK